MGDDCWGLDIGGVSLTLRGPGEWIGRWARDWASWTGAGEGWDVRLEREETLPAPTGPFFLARPRFLDDCCRLEAPGFVGEIAPKGRTASLRAHPAATPADLEYFVRSAFALRAFEQGALLFHAAGVIHRGVAYALFGRSGSGKTTAARLSAGRAVLNDDLILLRPCAVEWEAWATPFGRRRHPQIVSAPLRALLRLARALVGRIEPLPKGVALGEMVANSPVVNADVAQARALLTRCEEILRVTPVGLLRFHKSEAFWEVVDAYFG